MDERWEGETRRDEAACHSPAEPRTDDRAVSRPIRMLVVAAPRIEKEDRRKKREKEAPCICERISNLPVQVIVYHSPGSCGKRTEFEDEGRRTRPSAICTVQLYVYLRCMRKIPSGTMAVASSCRDRHLPAQDPSAERRPMYSHSPLPSCRG